MNLFYTTGPDFLSELIFEIHQNLYICDSVKVEHVVKLTAKRALRQARWSRGMILA